MSPPTAIVFGVGSARGVGGAAKAGPDGLLGYEAIAESYWMLHRQPQSAWTQELDLRPFKESW